MVWKPCLFSILGCTAVRLEHFVAHVDAPPTCQEHEMVNWRLCDDNLNAIAFDSNLAGNGPGTGAQEFRMKEIAEAKGAKLDLVVTAASDYKSYAQGYMEGGSKKGGVDMKGAYVSPCPSEVCKKRPEPQQTGFCYALIPFFVQTETKFHFRWENSETREEVELGYFDMTFYEIDRERDDWDGEGPDNEYLVFDSSATNLIAGARVSKTGDHTFESAEKGTWKDNPSKMGHLDDIYKSRSVKATYHNRGNWYISFGHKGPKTQNFDRVFEFNGRICPCVKVNWKLCKDDLSAIDFDSNLAGNGPDTGAQEFRLKGIAEIKHQKYDLVITAASDYKSFAQGFMEDGSKKGGVDMKGAYVSPCPSNVCTKRPEPQQTGRCYALIPFFVQTQTKFHFKWVNSDNGEAYTMEYFDINFYEMDRERDDWDGSGPDNEYLEFDSSATNLVHGPRVSKTGDHTFESKEHGTWKDNPSKMEDISDIQNERSVKATYKNRAEWDITFGHKGPAKQNFDRVMEFSGAYYVC